MTLSLLPERGPRLHVTVMVASPLAVLESSVQVHETVPVESATCFFFSPAANDSFPPRSLALTWHVAPGEVATTTVMVAVAEVVAGKLVISTGRSVGAAVGGAGVEVAFGFTWVGDRTGRGVVGKLAPPTRGPADNWELAEVVLGSVGTGTFVDPEGAPAPMSMAGADTLEPGGA